MLKEFFQKEGTKFFLKWLLTIVIIFLVIGGSLWLYNRNYENKIYKGVMVGDLNLEGKTKEQARILVQAKIDNLAKEGIPFVYNDKEVKIKAVVSAGEAFDLAHELWWFDTNKNMEEIYSIGRGSNWLSNSLNQLYYLFTKRPVLLEVQTNDEEIINTLRDDFGAFEKLGKNANFIFEEGQITISEEESGMMFDYKKMVETLKKQLENLNDEEVKMNLEIFQPTITKGQAEFLLEQISEVLDRAPITLLFSKPDYYTGTAKFKTTEWTISRKDLQELLNIKKNNKKDIVIGFDEEKLKEYLQTIAVQINTPAKDARFEIKDGRVTEWQSSGDGFVLNVPATINFLEEEFLIKKSQEIPLMLSLDQSKISNDNVNDLGIDELLGTGISNFAGSPNNRRHNIAVGAGALNGLLIKPGEEFSLLQALGEINAEAGYKQELVIKEGKTIPEYGGGLCQIGTTIFRAVLRAGLPVVERRNHSYRVGYYEPAGTDATIYDPWPDFKFKNDTDNYVLLQTRIEGDEAIFDFWGTSDGRKVELTNPVIYNIVSPGEPKEIETEDLKPGEKKKLESAHNGADAYFNRTITWPEELGKEVFEETFSSHYVPWQEVWLIGKEESVVTSTEEIIINP